MKKVPITLIESQNTVWSNDANKKSLLLNSCDNYQQMSLTCLWNKPSLKS